MKKIIAIAVASLSSLAFAGEVTLVDSSPFEEQMMMGSPDQITLKFSEEVKLTGLTIVSEETGPVNTGFSAAEATSTDYSHVIEELPMGSYTITWITESGEGSEQKGEIWFMVH